MYHRRVSTHSLKRSLEEAWASLTDEQRQERLEEALTQKAERQHQSYMRRIQRLSGKRQQQEQQLGEERQAKRMREGLGRWFGWY